MTTAAHTRGPWTVHKAMPDCVTFHGRHGTENLFLLNVDGYYACQSEADAQLIASAPDLLAALQTAVEALSSVDSDRWNIDMDALSLAITSASNAIAKATGSAA